MGRPKKQLVSKPCKYDLRWVTLHDQVGLHPHNCDILEECVVVNVKHMKNIWYAAGCLWEIYKSRTGLYFTVSRGGDGQLYCFAGLEMGRAGS